MHEQQIIEDLLAGLSLSGCEVRMISLVCTKEALIKRLKKDIAAGIRTEDALLRSIERLPLYEKLNTVKVDVSALSAQQTAAWIEETGRI